MLILKYGRMEWDIGFGMLEMLETNWLEERQDGVLLKRERGKINCEMDVESYV